MVFHKNSQRTHTFSSHFPLAFLPFKYISKITQIYDIYMTKITTYYLCHIFILEITYRKAGKEDAVCLPKIFFIQARKRIIKYLLAL